ncbi:MAG: methyltransferase domain-containing protein [Alphaproteobacteria bacterium]|nr:methyltransferase domain-containing protein [Alphaproteobacteria bacterium]
MAGETPGKPPRPAGLAATLLGITGQKTPAIVAPPAKTASPAGTPAATPARPPAGDTKLQAFLAATIADTRRALAADPRDAALHLRLAGALRMQGDDDGAAAAARQSFAIDGNEAAGYFLAGIGDGAVPARTPDSVVTALFDQYAATFDQHLVGRLRYRAPELVAATVRAARGDRATPCDVIDAGCGTGLAAPFLRSLARRLDGIDLSPRMIAAARAKGLYDALEVAELIALLRDRPARYDVIVACDVIVYFGDLAPVFAAAFAALRPGGFLAFSAERDEGTGWRLLPEGRYAHARAYVAATAAAAGFAVHSVSDAVLRTEAGADVGGVITVLARP